MVPQITPPPTLPQPLRPRQTYNPYDSYLPMLSSLYAELSSMYPELYSSYSYDAGAVSSLLAEYTSLYANPSYYSYSYSYPGYSASRTVTAASSTGTLRATGTALPAANGGNDGGNGGGGGGGMSMAAKIGIGVGVPLAILLLAGVGIFLWCAGKHKGKKSSTTIIAPVSSQHQQQQYQNHAAQQQFQTPQQQQMGYLQNPNQQGYMQGYAQHPTAPTPPPGYVQNQQYAGAYGGYAKGPDPGVMELEQEYHFARPGVVELGDGAPGQQGAEQRGVEQQGQQEEENAGKEREMRGRNSIMGHKGKLLVRREMGAQVEKAGGWFLSRVPAGEVIEEHRIAVYSTSFYGNLSCILLEIGIYPDLNYEIFGRKNQVYLRLTNATTHLNGLKLGTAKIAVVQVSDLSNKLVSHYQLIYTRSESVDIFYWLIPAHLYAYPLNSKRHLALAGIIPSKYHPPIPQQPPPTLSPFFYPPKELRLIIYEQLHLKPGFLKTSRPPRAFEILAPNPNLATPRNSRAIHNEATLRILPIMARRRRNIPPSNITSYSWGYSDSYSRTQKSRIRKPSLSHVQKYFLRNLVDMQLLMVGACINPNPNILKPSP
ncbi:uncharacterized protein BDR25DRAFT_390801 [Lindgomyces ingoldianus]|uniref:Uncharacterized protein n=1 Tax=Lindgomyces ingoldianus TaxID=673940 RepID=A0ACB6RFH6_9PLEO|nr:uncharacterized protein BDR25DRAFT_390801 [Lindgomyces ingoldianus]KAF2477252.1 hypothetical protein BDR25DRAFT_390801 [Lindgomyces ingoldianus]